MQKGSLHAAPILAPVFSPDMLLPSLPFTGSPTIGCMWPHGRVPTAKRIHPGGMCHVQEFVSGCSPTFMLFL